MIIITQASANTVVVTVTEKTTVAAPVYYLFSFRHTVTGTNNTCIAVDTSLYVDRYNKFTITESNTQARTSGTLKLEYAGQWSYIIYAQSSSTNLDPSLATEVVEVGLCTVLSGDTPYTDRYTVPTPAKVAHKVTI